MADTDGSRHRAGVSWRAGDATGRLCLWIALGLLAIASGAIAGILITGQGRGLVASRRAFDTRSEREVSTLLAGIRQEGDTLGRPSAPVTLQVFGDLECLTAKRWVLRLLPAIIQQFVRPGVIKIEYRSLKTDTHNAAVFVNQQSAALAAGKQNKMWTFGRTPFIGPPLVRVGCC